MLTMRGKVIKSTGSWYIVLDDEGRQWECRLRGKIRLDGLRSTNPVAVGDRVRYRIEGDVADETSPAVITEVLDRSNYVIRKSTNLSRQSHIIAANVDEAFIIVSLYFPEIKLPFLDRILVTCEVYGVPVSIVLNKVDMYRAEAPGELNNFTEIYRKAGYRVIETSAFTGEGIEELKHKQKKPNRIHIVFDLLFYLLLLLLFLRINQSNS